MFIKSVTIHGFKSYHEKSSVGPFHDGFNVILGRNGAGKSNFFSAIEFVLSDEYSNLRADQRASLLYAGSSGTSAATRAINAYVELLFDNKSGRFPDEKEEFNLRRTINSKMDQFQLNGKQITRKELKAMLETAGFSSSNPYHIVKQGKISMLATCSDKTRLDIVQDLAGSKVYDTKREESLKMFQACDVMFGETEELADQIAARQEELEKETENLEKLQKLELSKRSLEYLIFSKEIEDLNKKLKVIEESQLDFVEEIKETKPRLQKMMAEVEELKNRLENKSRRHRIICEDLEENRTVLEKNLKRKVGLELAMKDLLEEEHDRNAQEEKEKERRKLQEELGHLLEQRKCLEENLSQQMAQFEEIKEKLECFEQEKKEILDKNGRSRNFNSKEARNQWIESNIQEKSSIVEEKRLELLEARKSWTTSKDSLENLELETSQREADLEKLHNSVAKMKIELKVKEDENSKLATSSSERLQKVRRLEAEQDRAKENLRAAEARLRSLPGMNPVFTGIQSINKLKESSASLFNGYYGMVLDLFSCEDVLNIAVEQAVGLKVFNHVVSSDQVATRIVKELNKRKMPGVFNFIPLNRIKPKVWPELTETDVFKLQEKLEYQDDFEQLMQFVFGSTLVCRNLAVAVEVSHKTRADCVTLEGDKAVGKGVLSGGYISQDRNKLTSYLSYAGALKNLDQISKELRGLQDESSSTESDLSKKNNEIDEIKLKILRTENTKIRKEDALKAALRERDLLFSQKMKLEMQHSSLESTIKVLELSINNLTKELQEDFSSTMTGGDKERFKELVKLIEKTNKKFKKQSSNVGDAELKMSDVGGKIKEMRTNIQTVSDTITNSANIQEKLEALKRTLDETEKLYEKSNNIVKDLTAEEVKMEKEIASEKKELEAKESSLMTQRKSDDDNTAKLEKMLEKKVQYQSLLKKYTNQMKELGGIDPSKYRLEQKSELKTKLNQVLAEMKEFDDVNMKAFLQMKAFSEREEIEQRLKTLYRDKKSLSSLISSLDSKRLEQMAYTYKQMVKNFGEMFERIVPTGRGELILVGCPDHGNEMEKFSEATGVQVRVNFTGTGVMKNMVQLSGGQKTVVALAFILAIQRCDPAPFYLFDEVDAALDPEFRRSVAQLIAEQASSAQFLATTFRPELLETADKFFGVSFRGTSSLVKEVTRDVAQDFVQDS